jgi:hypothetical protein
VLVVLFFQPIQVLEQLFSMAIRLPRQPISIGVHL